MEMGTKQKKAAALVAEDHMTNPQIADEVGINVRTLLLWKQDADFAAEVDSHINTFMEIVKRSGIGRVENRVRRLDRDWHRLREVIESRARAANSLSSEQQTLMAATLKQGGTQEQAWKFAQEVGQLAPGMETGLLVRTVKFNKMGDEVEEYAVDTGLLAELRAMEIQAAKELGQWSDKAESRQYDMSLFDDDELDRLAAGESIDRVLASASRRRAGEAAPAAGEKG